MEKNSDLKHSTHHPKYGRQSTLELRNLQSPFHLHHQKDPTKTKVGGETAHLRQYWLRISSMLIESFSN